MDVRCWNCNKLFRVPDEKIGDAGVQFKCTRCSEYVKITSENFQEYKQSQGAPPPPPPSPEPPRETPPASLEQEMQQEEYSGGPTAFDIGGTEFTPPQQEPSSGPPVFDLSNAETGLPQQDEPTAGPAAFDLGGPETEAHPSAEQEQEGSGGPVFTIEPTSYDLGGTDETPAPDTFGAAAAQEPAGGAGIELSGYEMSDQTPELSASMVQEEAPSLPLSRERGRSALQQDVSEEMPEPSRETVHPFVSGASAGAVAGIGCALPVVAVLVLGVGMFSQFLSAVSADTPLYYTIGMAVANMMGLGILLGIVLAILQSGVRIKMFSFLGVVVSALIGGLIGAGQGFAVSFGSEALISVPIMTALAIKWSVQALLVSIAVVIIRRAMMAPRKESFSASMSAASVLGLVLSLSIVGAAVYGEVLSSTDMITAKDQAVDSMRQIASPAGLQVTNLSGYIDTNRHGDLVITGVVENTTATDKAAWFIVADVYDAQGGVLVKARMLNGIQMFSKRDFDVLAKRGENVQELKNKMLGAQGPGLPSRGMVNFEIRIVEPPAGITSFTATLQEIDLMQLFRDISQEMK